MTLMVDQVQWHRALALGNVVPFSTKIEISSKMSLKAGEVGPSTLSMWIWEKGIRMHIHIVTKAKHKIVGHLLSFCCWYRVHHSFISANRGIVEWWVIYITEKRSPERYIQSWGRIEWRFLMLLYGHCRC